jgi:hypothetical protein
LLKAHTHLEDQMGLFKGLVLGSAAAVTMAAGSAFAADLPSRKAAPVAYVKICDVYGRGFYYIPGTNTCLKVGGRVRVEYGWRRAQHTSTNGTNFYEARKMDTLGWRSRAYVNMDARTQTAYGTVQSVFSISLRSRSGIFNGAANGANGNTSASPQVYAAYIRFAGFTFGRAPHTFSSGPGYIFYWTNHAGGGAIGALQLSYTAVLGSGLSATFSLQDKNDFGLQKNANHPNRKPNIVLSLRMSQGWGFIRGSVAYGWNVTTATTPTTEKGGWAAGVDAKINLPSLARGDALYLSAAYSDGLLDYVTGGNNLNGSKAKDGRITGGYQPSHANWYSNGTSYSNAKAWRAMVALTHYWSPTLRSNIAWSYLNIDLPTAAGADWTGGSAWQAAHQLVWSPTKGFDIGLEVYYAKITHDVSASRAAALAAIGVKRNPDDWAVKLRVQRTF